MNRQGPPIFATWLLQHLGDPYRREALIGDLIEEYRRGRSNAWYWRQVSFAALAGGLSALRRKLPALRAVLAWWCVCLILGVTLKSPAVLFLLVDPGFFWWVMRGKRRARRRLAGC
jgi:hypothetical protein